MLPIILQTAFIDAKIPALKKWPITAFNYPQLRSLRIEGEMKKYTTPIIIPNGILIPPEGHKMLERLEINYFSASLLLLDLPGDISLSTLLPRLSELSITGCGYLSEAALRSIPPSVTSLTLDFFEPHSLHYHPDPDISILSLLPPRLTLLNLISIWLKIGYDRELPELLLPSSLTSVALNVDLMHPVLSVLPKDVVSLHFWSQIANSIKLSELPRELQKMQFSGHENLTIVVDTVFPPDLTCWVEETLIQYEWELGELGIITQNLTALLPPSMTTYDPFDADLEQLDLRAILPNVKSYELTSYCGLPNTIPPATKLFTYDEDFTVYLPMFTVNLVSLRCSVLNTPAWLDTFSLLVNLKSLHLNEPYTCHLPSSTWKILHGRLQHLNASITHFESLEDLYGPWKDLTSLKLTLLDTMLLPSDLQEGLSKFDSTSSELRELVRYPLELKKLSLFLLQEWHVFMPPVKHLKHLKKFKCLCAENQINDDVYVDMELINEVLAELPPSITYLKAQLPCHIRPQSLYSLPRHLKVLQLDLPTNKSINSAWINEHFFNLPPSLTSLTVFGRLCINTSDLLDHVPSGLSHMVFDYRKGVVIETTAHQEITRQLNLVRQSAII